MRTELLRVGMSQMSAGSKTDVGAYHRCAAGVGGGRARPYVQGWCSPAAASCSSSEQLSCSPCCCEPSTPPVALLFPHPASQLATHTPPHLARSLCRDDSKATEDNLADLNGQFTLADHRPGARQLCCASGQSWCARKTAHVCVCPWAGAAPSCSAWHGHAALRWCPLLTPGGAPAPAPALRLCGGGMVQCRTLWWT